MPLAGQSGVPVGRVNMGLTPFSLEPLGLRSLTGHSNFSAKTGEVLGKADRPSEGSNKRVQGRSCRGGLELEGSSNMKQS